MSRGENEYRSMKIMIRCIPSSSGVSASTTVNLQLVLTTPGTYLFYCDKQLLFFPSHRDEGMQGYLKVR